MNAPLPADVAGSLALDARGLDALKRQAKDSPTAALSAAASQFEALFVQMLMKSMREALPADGPLISDASRTYTGMFDQQVAQQIAQRGIGLRQMIERQLAKAMPGVGVPNANTAGHAISKPASPTGSKSIGQSTAPQASAVAKPADVRASSTIPEHVRTFIDTMKPYAEAAARAARVPVDVLLAQAGLETGWGRHQPKTAQGEATHNLFGIKAGKDWTGASVVAKTNEYVAGAVVRTVDRFRSYHSYADAFADFARLIGGKARYADAVANAHDPDAYAKALQRGGYATDPHYADKLAQAIRMVAGHVARSSDPQVLAQRAVTKDRA
jgi:flagellar protein FlgJ